MLRNITFLKCFETYDEAKDWTTKIMYPVLILHLNKDNLNLFTVLSKEDIEVLTDAD